VFVTTVIVMQAYYSLASPASAAESILSGFNCYLVNGALGGFEVCSATGFFFSGGLRNWFINIDGIRGTGVVYWSV
jgi:hypothetical protein